MRLLTAARRASARRWAATLAVVVLLGLVAAGPPAEAHSPLIWTQPADAATLASAPSRVTMRFASGVDVVHTRVSVLSPDGRPHQVGAPATGVNDVLAVAVDGAGPRGTWQVRYSVATWDGHVTEGAFSFVVAPGTGPPASGSPWWPYAVGAVAVIGLVVALRTSRRRPTVVAPDLNGDDHQPQEG